MLMTNPTTQTVEPGQAVVFTAHSGKGCVSPSGTSAKLSKGCNRVSFGANIGGAAGTQANLALSLGGEIVPYSTMVATITAATDVFNVSRTIPINCCCNDFGRVSVINTGTTPVTVANPSLYIEGRN